LLKADGRFAPLPIAAGRTVKLGGPAATVGFPVQDFMRKPGNHDQEFIHGFLDSLFATVGAAREIGAGKIPRPVHTFFCAPARSENGENRAAALVAACAVG
jgi:hypothetical protein